MNSGIYGIVDPETFNHSVMVVHCMLKKGDVDILCTLRINFRDQLACLSPTKYHYMIFGR